MRVRRFSIGLVVLAAAALTAASASAAPRWQAPVTVELVRGVADPDVGIDRAGRATVVYANAPLGESFGRPGIYAKRRLPGGAFSAATRLGNGARPRIAVTPAGDTAVAWVDGDRIRVLRQPAPGTLGGPGQTVATIEGAGADELRLVLDGAGRATVVWARAADGSQVPGTAQLRSATLDPAGETGPIQQLGPPAHCPRLTVTGNLAGDVAAFCFGYDDARLHVRAPGASQFESEPLPIAELDPTGSSAWGDLTVDGTGRTTVSAFAFKGGASTWYRDRPRGGTLTPWRSLGITGTASAVAQEGRTAFAWNVGGGVAVAERQLGGAPLGPARTVRVADASAAPTVGTVATVAPVGPLPLLLDRRALTGASLPFVALELPASGGPSLLGRPTAPGKRELPIAVAGAENGLALAAWEQSCGAGFAVMAMALDGRRGTSAPPCQDRRAPRIVVRPKRARLAGRTVRVRIGCDERCRIGVRTRVLGAGSGRPLATAKTKRAALLGARRFRTFKLRMSPTEAARLSGALAVGRRVTVRLALPVRDSYENGAVRRVAVPLRR